MAPPNVLALKVGFGSSYIKLFQCLRHLWWVTSSNKCYVFQSQTCSSIQRAFLTTFIIFFNLKSLKRPYGVRFLQRTFYKLYILGKQNQIYSFNLPHLFIFYAYGIKSYMVIHNCQLTLTYIYLFSPNLTQPSLIYVI